MQLSAPPDTLLALEQKCLRKFASGPGNWVMPRELFCLQNWFKFSIQFRSIAACALASTVRIAQFENHAADLKIHEVKEASLHNPGRFIHWSSWYKGFFANHICNTLSVCNSLQVFPDKIWLQL